MSICSAEPSQECVGLTFLPLYSSGSGPYCDISIDGIGTCWPRSGAGQMVSRPCPEILNGVKYNTTSRSTLSAPGEHRAETIHYEGKASFDFLIPLSP